MNVITKLHSSVQKQLRPVMDTDTVRPKYHSNVTKNCFKNKVHPHNRSTLERFYQKSGCKNSSKIIFINIKLFNCLKLLQLIS